MQETQLYNKSATHYIVGITSSIVYNISKLGLVIYQLVAFSRCEPSMKVNEASINQWLIALAVHSFCLMLIQFSHLKYINDPEYRSNLALKLNQVRFNDDHQAPLNFFEDSKQISLLAKQIKYEVLKSIGCGKFLTRLFGIYYQVLFGIGVWFFFNMDRTGCQEFSFYFLCAVLLLCIYQYIDLYIIMIAATIFSPCLLIFAMYYCCQLCAKEQQRQEIRLRLNIQKYKPNKLEGDQECCICRCAYELDEPVMLLQCSQYHHFHESCIMSWMNVNSTCPLCRKPI